MIDPINYRIAVMYKNQADFLGYGGYIYRALEKICRPVHYLPGEEPEGMDEYWYIDDGPTDYMTPKYRPATYFAMDAVVKPFWYLDPIDHYVERSRNFDRVYMTSTASTRYFQEHGLKPKMVGFAADLEYHRPCDVPRDKSWMAVWHNCGDRIEATRRAYERFPDGQWLWAGNKLYAEYISRGKCALNWLRGDIVNMRTFEVMACNIPLVQTRHEDMAYYGFTENEHYLGFDGIDEMLDKIQWVLDCPGEAGQMAYKAYKLVQERHTYYHRVLEILNGYLH